MKFFTSLLAFFGGSIAMAMVLPDDFTLQPETEGPPTLIWSSNDTVVHMGASRPEFFWSDGTLFGYPRQVHGQLQLTLNTEQLTALHTPTNLTLQVRTGGGRRVIRRGRRSAVTVNSTTPSFPTPTVPTDPAKRGIYEIRRDSYELAGIVLEKYPVPVEVLAEVTDTPDAPGPRPLVLFLHGRHETCYQGGSGGSSTGEWPCPEGWLPIPSYKGFRYITEILASQGYIVVSISANGIDGQDYLSGDMGISSRSQLIRYHLSLWAQWHMNGKDPWGSRFQGRVNMNQIVLVGHSRGGEGVHRAAIDATSTDPYKIVGLVAYAPTAYGHQVTPDVHSATILPTCDGDAYELPGQSYIDRSRDIAYSEALRTAVISLGSNHNFFNTEWTPRLAQAPTYDDWWDATDPVCGKAGGSARLTSQEQQTVAATYTAALIQMAIYQDRSMLQLLDGSFVRPAAIGRAEVATSAVGGSKHRLLYRPEDSSRPVLRNGMRGQECVGTMLANTSMPVCYDNGNWISTPHWDAINDRPSPQAMELQWTNRLGATAQFPIAKSLRNLIGLNSLDVRIANDPAFQSVGAKFDLVLLDSNGRNATMRTSMSMIQGWPGDGFLNRVHARTLRGSLGSVRSKVDLGNIVAILLVTRSVTGRVWVLDMAASQARVATPAVLNLPVLSIATTRVKETNGPTQYVLNITSDRPLTAPASIWVQGWNAPLNQGYQLNLVPSFVGSRSNHVAGQIVVNHTGDTVRADGNVELSFSIEAIQGAVIGNYSASLIIVDEEPVPKLSTVAKSALAQEGEYLQWTLRLSSPTNGASYFFEVVSPSVNDTELSTSDVASEWLRRKGVYTPPDPPVPLSSVLRFIEVRFDYGMDVANLTIPLTNETGVLEGGETILLNSYDNSNPLNLTGKVLAHA